MWSKLKSWHPEDRTALVCTIVVLAGTAAMVTLRFTYRPGFKIGSTILFIGACVLFGMLGLAALLIAPFLIYILLVEPLRDWYFARKYGWAKARNPRFREWLARQVESLREFGFFEEFEDLSEKQRLTPRRLLPSPSRTARRPGSISATKAAATTYGSRPRTTGWTST